MNDIPSPPKGWTIVSADDYRLGYLPVTPLYYRKGEGWKLSNYLPREGVGLDDTNQYTFALPTQTEEEDAATDSSSSPLTRQEGGSHYKDCKMQPVEFIHANKLNFLEGSVVKRVCRHRRKNGAEDIRKAIHELELILALEYPEDKTLHPSCPD